MYDNNHIMHTWYWERTSPSLVASCGPLLAQSAAPPCKRHAAVDCDLRTGKNYCASSDPRHDIIFANFSGVLASIFGDLAYLFAFYLACLLALALAFFLAVAARRCAPRSSPAMKSWRREAGEERKEERRWALIKSNNPHLAGMEKQTLSEQFTAMPNSRAHATASILMEIGFPSC